MSTIGKKIKERREALGLTQQELADTLNYKSRSSINKIEMGLADIPQSKIVAFANALQTTPSYLMGLEEQKPKKTSELFFNLQLFGGKSNPDILPIKTKKVPLLGTIACGDPILASENIDEYVLADGSVQCDFALRCKGDSMINARIFDGDIVYIRQQADVDNGEIAAILIGDEATIKRVYKYPDRMILQPENPTFQPMVYEGDKLNEIRIIGKAVAFTSVVR